MDGIEVVPGSGSVTPTALELPLSLTFEEWKKIGQQLFRVRQSCHWWIGDWLNFGERRYGEMYSQALDETSYAYSTLTKDKFVSSRFEICRRRQNLSWSHHAAVAALPPDEQDRWLDHAEKEEWSREDLREEMRRIRAEVADDRKPTFTDLPNPRGTETSLPAGDAKCQWGVWVECESEEQQNRLLQRLSAEGFHCRTLNQSALGRDLVRAVTLKAAS